MFSEFIQGISQFSVKGDKNTKLKFAFRIYDMDRDGFISNGELFQVGINVLSSTQQRLSHHYEKLSGMSVLNILSLVSSYKCTQIK